MRKYAIWFGSFVGIFGQSSNHRASPPSSTRASISWMFSVGEALTATRQGRSRILPGLVSPLPALRNLHSTDTSKHCSSGSHWLYYFVLAPMSQETCIDSHSIIRSSPLSNHENSLRNGFDKTFAWQLPGRSARSGKLAVKLSTLKQTLSTGTQPLTLGWHVCDALGY